MRSNINGLETLAKISFYPPEDIVIGYHDDMDGMLAAVAVKHRIKEIKGEEESKITYQKMQYHKDRTTGLDGLIGKKLVILVDFCMPREPEFIELKENGLEEIHIYDHHKTAMDFIENISLDQYHLKINTVLHDIDPSLVTIKVCSCDRIYDILYTDYIDPKNTGILSNRFSKFFFCSQPDEFEVYFEIEGQLIKDIDFEMTILPPEFDYVHYYFDMSKSGCTIAYEQFIESQKDGYNITLGILKLNFLQKYAADYDLWKFELLDSKDINAGLKIIAQELKLLKNPDIMYNFIFGDSNAIDTLILEEKFGTALKIVNQNVQTLLDACKLVGRLSVTFNNMYIDKIKNAATKDKIPLITVGGIKMFVLNNGHLISEVGNMLTQFGYPSVQYFVVHEVKDGMVKEPELVLGFRSTDELPDVSVVAKALGGGGHRNACGTGIKITDLEKLLKSEF